MFLVPMGTDLKINNQQLLIFFTSFHTRRLILGCSQILPNKERISKLYFFPFLEHCFRDKDKRSLIGRRPDLNIMHADYLSG